MITTQYPYTTVIQSKANVSIIKDIVLKDINYQDNIYFIVKSDIGDRTIFDNTDSFFSWQDERSQQELENKYKEILDNNKFCLEYYNAKKSKTTRI